MLVPADPTKTGRPYLSETETLGDEDSIADDVSPAERPLRPGLLDASIRALLEIDFDESRCRLSLEIKIPPTKPAGTARSKTEPTTAPRQSVRLAVTVTEVGEASDSGEGALTIFASRL